MLRLESLDTLRAAARAQGCLNREVLVAADARFDWSELTAAAAATGLFSDKKLLEIHIPGGKPGKSGGEALQALAGRLPEDTVTVVVLPKLEKAQLSAKWFTALEKVAQVIEARTVAPAQLPAWISRRLHAHNLQIDADALAFFVEKVEGNLPAAQQEIEKLALLHPTGSRLTLADAQTAVANVARFDVFQLAAAWMEGDLLRLNRLLDTLETAGEEPVLLLWAFAEDIRTLIRLKAALAQGQALNSIAGSLRLWGDKKIFFFAPKAARRLSGWQLTAALQECARADRQIKGAEAGNAWQTLRRTAAQLAGAGFSA